MQFLSLGVGVLAVVVLVIGIATLGRLKWFFAWFRGTLGFLFITGAVFLGLLAFNMRSYHAVVNDAPVATITFEKQDKQRYSAAVSVLLDGTEKSFNLSGDLWQVDARIIKWKGTVARMGLRPGYKLGRIQGRFHSLEQERLDNRTVYRLSEPDVGIDLWAKARMARDWLPWVDAVYGNATFLPMKDGASYVISLTGSGLMARPMNEQAAGAVSGWVE